MLDLNPEIVCAVSERAREFQAQDEVAIPEGPESLEDDWSLQVLADFGENLLYQETKTLIEDLEPDQQVSLVALMWIGRGDFAADELADALAEARDAHNNRTAEYLLATPLVAAYLEEALAQLGYDCP